MAIADDITVEALERDPYPIYARLRREAPVCWVPAVNMWLATCWAEAQRVASEPDTFAADLPNSPVDRTMGSPTILTCDGPPHKELRKAVDPKFRPHVVETYMEILVGPIAEARLAALDGEAEADLMVAYFEPVSVLSLGAVLGLREFDADTLRRWFAELADGATNFEQDPAKEARGRGASAEIDERLAPLLDRLERIPDESALAHMLHAGMPAGETRARAFLMPTLKVILLGGMQEPGHGAGSVLYALLAHPRQLAQVRSDPDLLPAAIEEGLRWIAPIGTQGRRVTRPVTLGGVDLDVDAPISAVVASANRDDARFEDPDRFDIHRPRRRTATFGFGPHFCSGHAFSRVLVRIALARLLRRHPALELAVEPEFRGWEFRAPRELRVRLDGSERAQEEAGMTANRGGAG